MSSSLSSVSSGVSNITSNTGIASPEKSEIQETAKSCFDLTVKESEASRKKKKKKRKKAKNLTKDLAASSYYTFTVSLSQSEEFVFKVPIALFPQSIQECLLKKPAPSIQEATLKKRSIIEVKSIKPEKFENLGGLDYKKKLATSMSFSDIVLAMVIRFLNVGREGMDILELITIDRTFENNTVSYQKRPLLLNDLELMSKSEASKFIQLEKEECNNIIQNYNEFAEKLASIFTEYNVSYNDRPSNIFSTIVCGIIEKYELKNKDRDFILKKLNLVDLNVCLKQIFNNWKNHKIEKMANNPSDLYEFYIRGEVELFFEKKENQSNLHEQFKLGIGILNRFCFANDITALKNDNVKAAYNEIKKLYEPLGKWLSYLSSVKSEDNKIDVLYYGSQLFETLLRKSFICSKSGNIKELEMGWVINSIKKIKLIIDSSGGYSVLSGLLNDAVNSVVLENYRVALYFLDEFAKKFYNTKPFFEQSQDYKLLDLEVKLMLNEIRMELFYNVFGKELDAPLVEKNIKNLECAVKNLTEFSEEPQNLLVPYQNWIDYLEEDHPLAIAFERLCQLQKDLEKIVTTTVEFNKSILENIKNSSKEEVKKLKNLHKEAHTWDHLLRLVKDKNICPEVYDTLLRKLLDSMRQPEKDFFVLITNINHQLKQVHDLTFIQYLVDVDSPNLPTLEQVQQTFKGFNQQIKQAASPLFAYFQANHNLFRTHEATDSPELTLQSSFCIQEVTLRPLKVNDKKFKKFEGQVEKYKNHIAMHNIKPTETTFEIECVHELAEEPKEKVQVEVTQEREKKAPYISQPKKSSKKQNVEPKAVIVPKASLPQTKQEKDPIIEAADEIFSTRKPKEIIANLKKFLKNYDNWKEVNGKGSHKLIKINGVSVAIPMHKNTPTGTVKGGIQKQFLQAFGYKR